MSRIETLTPEQEALIPVIRDKWRAIAHSTEPIDRQKATEAVKAAYAAIDKKEPEILFCNNPYVALKTVMFRQQTNQYQVILSDLCELGFYLRNQLVRQLDKQLSSQLHSQLVSQLSSQLEREIGIQWNSQLEGQLNSKLNSQFDAQRHLLSRSCIQPELRAGYASLLDFCFSVLNCTDEQSKGQTFQSLVKYCGWIFPFEKTALVCDRPIKLSFDQDYRLHAEAEPAIEFADGYSLYSHHGVTLPEKYGRWHPNKWQARWLLTETNAEIRRVLIQGIGYKRICQKLQALELDSWQEYRLLKIDNADIEPIYLLKMTCPSTGFIHALRVPPNMKSARDAIRWVNWGINPEEFGVQT